MYLDVDILPDEIVKQTPARELAEAKAFREGGFYLAQFLDELYNVWGLQGRHDKEFVNFVKDKVGLIRTHSYLNNLVCKDDSVPPEVKALVEKFEKDLSELVEK